MKNNISRLGIWILLLASMWGAGCSEASQEEDAGASRSIHLSVKRADGTVVAPSGVKSIALYICDKGEIVWLNRVNAESSSQVDVPVAQLGRGVVYCLVNEAVCPDAEALAVGSSEQAIRALYSSFDAGAGAEGVIAMYGSADLTGLNHGSAIEMRLMRNMARFDIVPQHADIVPQSIVVKGLPLKGALFADREPVSAETYDLAQTFATTPSRSGAVQGAFYVHEFDAESGFKPRVEITSLYGGVELKSYIDLSQAERNKAYKIFLRAVDGELVGDIVLEGDMEVGDDNVVIPDEKGSPIFINPTETTLSEGVVLGSDNRRLLFPSKGGEAIVALTGESIEYLGQEGLSESLTLEKQADGRYKISVKANRTINPSHEAVLLRFIPKAELDPEKYVRISVVMQSYAPFDVVTMAGLDWTTVNAQGQAVASYPIQRNGDLPRDLIASDWNRWSGVGEQWGPRPGRATGGLLRLQAWFNVQWTPGISYQTLPNINGAIIGGNNLTQWDNHAYCPVGWRLPKRSEFAAIWPPAGTVIDDTTSPVSYTTSAGNFTAKLEKIGNNCIVISDGVQEVIFPLAGFREHNGIHNPGNNYDQHGRDVGSSVYYWCYDRPVGGNAYIFGYEKVTTQGGALPRYTIANMSFNPAAWLNSRCVREVK